MKNWAKISLASAWLVGAGTALALWSGAAGWNAETARQVEKLKQPAQTNEANTVSFKSLENLPAPVARYFRFALKDGQPFVRTAKIKIAGEFNLNDRWIPFDSTEHFSANPPAFIWDAEMRMNPLMTVRVRDAYLDGRGAMTGKIFGLFPVVDARDDAKLDTGALMRYLAEAVWLPTALLPSENVRWSAIDENRALATLTDGATIVSLEFIFNDADEITGVFSPARFREMNGEYKPFPWAGRFANYREYGGMRIPSEGEVEWQTPEKREPYWRGRIVEARYDFAH